MIEPVSKWGDEEVNFEGGVIWKSELDKQFLCEVIRSDAREGWLRIFDKDKDYELVFDKPVGLSYGAQWGPDVDDVAYWQDTILEFIDNGYKIT